MNTGDDRRTRKEIMGERRARRRSRRIVSMSIAVVAVTAAAFYLIGPFSPLRSVQVEESESTFPAGARKEPESEEEAEARRVIEEAGQSLPGPETGEQNPEAPDHRDLGASEGTAAEPYVSPIEGAPIYPFVESDAKMCPRWSDAPFDYPHFGAPRENGRTHAGVDLYPEGGEGSPVRAIAEGRVLKSEVFFVRSTGEETWAVLVDHGDFVVNYAELKPPGLRPGDTVTRGQVLGGLSGTEQLHFEMYSGGTRTWTPWYQEKPANLIDPTGFLQTLFLAQQ